MGRMPQFDLTFPTIWLTPGVVPTAPMWTPVRRHLINLMGAARGRNRVDLTHVRRWLQGKCEGGVRSWRGGPFILCKKRLREPYGQYIDGTGAVVYQVGIK